MTDTRFTETDRPVDQRPYGRTPPVHAETAAESRQGPLGRPVLYVLIGGLALAAVYVIGTQIWSGSEDLPPAAQIQEEPAVVTPPAVNLAPAPAAVAPAPLITPAPAPTPAPATPAPVVPAG